MEQSDFPINITTSMASCGGDVTCTGASEFAEGAFGWIHPGLILLESSCEYNCVGQADLI